MHHRAASFYEAQGEWAEAITHALQAADYSTAARLMEQTVEQFWLRGEAATIARWVLALPDRQAREHARLLLTTALYLLTTVVQTTREQRERRYQEARQLMARVEAALQAQTDETNSQISATGADAGNVDREAHAAEHALLKFRLGLLRMLMAVIEATASGDFERLRSMEVIEEALTTTGDRQTVPLQAALSTFGPTRGGATLPRCWRSKSGEPGGKQLCQHQGQAVARTGGGEVWTTAPVPRGPGGPQPDRTDEGICHAERIF